MARPDGTLHRAPLAGGALSPHDRHRRTHAIPGLTQTEKGVIVALATFANEAGRCNPSHALQAQGVTL